MTPQQFYGWTSDHEFLHEAKAARRETWLVKKLRGEDAAPEVRPPFRHHTYLPLNDYAILPGDVTYRVGEK